MTALDHDEGGSGREVCIAWRSKSVAGDISTGLVTYIHPSLEARHSAFLPIREVIRTSESAN